MKTIKTLLFVCFSIGIAAFTCQKEPLQNEGHLGEPFILDLNGTYSLNPSLTGTNDSDSSLTVNFKKVLFDARCPMSTCSLCYGSSARISVFFTHRTDTATISLTILGCREEYECNDNLYYHVDTLGYRFCLLRLDPYPDGGNKNVSNYSVKLNITKL
jgi:hypothetical protein